jgi:hypothetical protein
MAQRPTQQVLYGSAEMVSPWFSNRWALLSNGQPIASLERFGRLHVSTVSFPDGTRWLLEPSGSSVVRAIDGPDSEFARVTRRSWWGRRWDITGTGFAYQLVSHPVPRRWMLAVGGAPIAAITGSLLSYNTIRFDMTLAVPLPTIVLAWHVIARPWEAAAAPRGLLPAPRHAVEGTA